MSLYIDNAKKRSITNAAMYKIMDELTREKGQLTQ